MLVVAGNPKYRANASVWVSFGGQPTQSIKNFKLRIIIILLNTKSLEATFNPVAMPRCKFDIVDV